MTNNPNHSLDAALKPGLTPEERAPLLARRQSSVLTRSSVKPAELVRLAREYRKKADLAIIDLWSEEAAAFRHAEHALDAALAKEPK